MNDSKLTLLPSLSILLFFSVFASPALCSDLEHKAQARLAETWIVTGNPTTADLTRWEKLPTAPTKLRVLLESTPTAALAEVPVRFRGLGSLEIITSTLPTAASAPIWKTLAAHGATFVSNTGVIPNENQIQLLNEIGFSRVVFVLIEYPQIKAETQRLLALQAPYSISFSVGKYPQYMEKWPLAELPATIPLTFTTDSWPSYAHMDTLNLLVQKDLRLRVKETALSERATPYLLHIPALTEVIFENEADVAAIQWERLGPLNVRWSNSGVPSAKALQAFDASKKLGPRRLVIDRDAKLTAAERARLEATTLEIEWIHEAP